MKEQVGDKREETLYQFETRPLRPKFRKRRHYKSIFRRLLRGGLSLVLAVLIVTTAIPYSPVRTSAAQLGLATWSSLWGINEGPYVQCMTTVNGTLYAATNAGVLVWDGVNWSLLGGSSGVNAPSNAGYSINSLTSVNGILYAGTNFGLWSWNGTNWSQVGGAPTSINSLTNINGTLYVGAQTNGVWSWNGTSWSQLGGSSGLTGYAKYINILIDINGILYAGTGNGVWSWNGTNWSQLGGAALTYNAANVQGLTTLNGVLYAGTYNGVWSWNGTNWSQVGNLIGLGYLPQGVNVATVNGVLYAMKDSGTANGVWSWDGTNWSQVGGPAGLTGAAKYVSSLIIFNGSMYAGTDCGVWSWNGTNWIPLGLSSQLKLNAVNVKSLTNVSGNLYAQTKRGVWSWNGTNWSQLDSPTDPDLMTKLTNINGVLYACESAGVWFWDGTKWVKVGNSLANVYDLATFNGVLYAGTLSGVWSLNGTSWSQVTTASNGTSLTTINGILYAAASNNGVSAWNGTNWSQVGGPLNISSLSSINGVLYAGANGSGVWSWNGTNWSQVGASQAYVNSLVNNNGHLYLGTPANGVWSWNGSYWSQVGGSSGLTGTAKFVSSLTTVNGVLYTGTSSGVWELSEPILRTVAVTGTIKLAAGGGGFDLNQLVLSGLDQFGNPYNLTGLPVTWRVTSGNSYASLSGSTLNPISEGLGTVTATVGGVTSNALNFTVNPAPLTVSSSTPANYATNVATNSPITVTFNNNIQAGLNYNRIVLTDSFNNIVKTDVTINGNTLTVKPGGNLNFGTPYILNIPPESLQDLSGNALALGTSIIFTTATPTLIVNNPTDNSVINQNWVTVSGYTDYGTTVKVNGITVSTDLAGNFSRVISNLLPGTNSITITATDKAGNTSTLTRTVKTPAVSVTAPNDNYQTNKPTITITGKAPVGGTLTVNGTAATIDSYGNFSNTVNLTAGSNTITLTGTDVQGYSTTLTRTVIYRAPTLTVTSPTDNLFTNKSTVTVTGRAEAGTTSLTINGTGVSTDAYGTFSYPYNLTEGSNNIAVAATGAGGLTTTVTRTVTYDITPPTLMVNNPIDNSVINQNWVTVSGYTEYGITVKVNGISVSTDLAGNFSRMISNLPPGTNTITITATDKAGNISTTTRTVKTPAVSVTAPADNYQTNKPIITVTGKAPVGGTLTVNGTAGTIDSYGNFSYTVNLTAGSNTITLIGTDIEGYSTTLTRTVVYRAPTLTVNSPTDKLFTNKSTVTVSGKAEIGTTSLTINGTAVSPDSYGNFSYVYNLTEGSNNIAVAATGAGGLTTTITRSVTYDITPPTLMVTAPVDKLLVSKSSVTVYGTVEYGSTLKINGVIVGTDPSGNFNRTIYNLPIGTSVITVTATDKAGNATTSTMTVIRTI